MFASHGLINWSRIQTPTEKGRNKCYEASLTHFPSFSIWVHCCLWFDFPISSHQRWKNKNSLCDESLIRVALTNKGCRWFASYMQHYHAPPPPPLHLLSAFVYPGVSCKNSSPWVMAALLPHSWFAGDFPASRFQKTCFPAFRLNRAFDTLPPRPLVPAAERAEQLPAPLWQVMHLMITGTVLLPMMLVIFQTDGLWF